MNPNSISFRWSAGLFVVLTAALTLFAWNTHAPFMWQVLTHASDPLGYYQYLPAGFIDGSWDHLGYSYSLENGGQLNLFTIGVAILQAPFFLVALGWSYAAGGPVTGYELPFVFARLLATSCYTALGLMLLLQVLLRRYDLIASLITIALLLFGTTLYYYTVFAGGMSHAYSFFLMAWGLYLTVSMLDHPRADRLVGLFICCGLLVLIRPLNVLAVVIFAFYGTDPLQAIRERIRWLRSFPAAGLLGLLLVVLVWLPQLLYWKRITGSWLVFTYGKKDEGFTWADPHLFDVLLSHQNGWFIYTPLMAVVMGYLLWQAWHNATAARSIFVVWVLVWYVYASWWCWWLGGAFGFRGFIEYYAFLALPLAGLVALALRQEPKVRYAILAVFLVFIRLNINLSRLYQYPWESPTWTWAKLGAVYWKALAC